MSANKGRSSSKSAKRQRTSSQPRVTLEETYDVELIHDKQVQESRIMYKIQWCTYPLPKDHTWEPIENIRTVVGDIHEYEERHKGEQVKVTGEIDLEQVAQYRDSTIEKEQMKQILGFDTVDQVLFVLYSNAMVITLPVKEIDSVASFNAIGCLVDKNFEEIFYERYSETETKTLIESEQNKPLPNTLSKLIDDILCENGWPDGDPTGMMVSPLMTQERVKDGHKIIQCTLCDTCGERFERPNVPFFQHLRQSEHNGSYLKDIVKSELK